MKKEEVHSMGDSGYIEDVMPQLEKAAGVVARKWPTVTSEDDLYQDLVEHFLDRPGSLEALAKLPVSDQVGIATRVGHDKVSGQRDDFEVFSGNFHYSIGEVQALLRRGCIMENVDKFQGSSFDVQQAMIELRSKNANYWNILIRKYVQGEKFPSSTNESKHLVPRAEALLTTLMNRAKRKQLYEWENGGGRLAERPRPYQAATDQDEYNGWDFDSDE